MVKGFDFKEDLRVVFDLIDSMVDASSLLIEATEFWVSGVISPKDLMRLKSKIAPISSMNLSMNSAFKKDRIVLTDLDRSFKERGYTRDSAEKFYDVVYLWVIRPNSRFKSFLTILEVNNSFHKFFAPTVFRSHRSVLKEQILLIQDEKENLKNQISQVEEFMKKIGTITMAAMVNRATVVNSFDFKEDFNVVLNLINSMVGVNSLLIETTEIWNNGVMPIREFMSLKSEVEPVNSMCLKMGSGFNDARRMLRRFERDVKKNGYTQDSAKKFYGFVDMFMTRPKSQVKLFLEILENYKVFYEVFASTVFPAYKIELKEQMLLIQDERENLMNQVKQAEEFIKQGRQSH